ncbi:MAG TPA: tail fiber domain-containing protein [Propylenella sp.]
MQKRTYLAVIAAAAVLLSTGTVLSVRAPNVPEIQPRAIIPVAANGTAGRIAKFTSATNLGNSVLFQNGADIGLGTTAPLGKLDIRAQNALNITGVQPFLTFRDINAGNARHVIKSVNGGLNLLAENRLNGTNPNAFVRIDRNGRVGLGTVNPQRALQIGPSIDAMFTIEPSDVSPNAGFIRFGDGTGWQLHFGRSRQFSRGPLNTGTTGVIMTIKDNSPSGFSGTVIFKGGVQVDSLFGSGASPTPLCRNSLNLLSLCSSSRRYKTGIEPFSGGLRLINRLQPVSFIWKEDQHPDIGLIAEDVEKIEPRLTYRNEKGQIEGVKYDLLTAVLVNAIKEQDERLQRQQELIERLQSAVARLEKMN